MLSASYIARLDGDRECLDALAWLARTAERPKSGRFHPPLTRLKPKDEPTKHVAMYIRLARVSRHSNESRVARLDVCNGDDEVSFSGDDAAIAAAQMAHVFTPDRHNYLVVASGQKRRALDVWLHVQGRIMVQAGYTLQPCLSSGGVSWIIVRKGRYKWTITYFETATGVPVSIGLGLAHDAARSTERRLGMAEYIYSATCAAQRLYLRSFGVALNPTVGMTALQAARVSLPSGFQKWRPPALLHAVEREGKGYRGGMTFASPYRGRSVQIDVTRQYTATLADHLPHEYVFGPFPGFSCDSPGVYMCRVRSTGGIPYPVGVWRGSENGFTYESSEAGEFITPLHTPEIRALILAGWQIWPSYGYTATRTFTLASHVEKLQRMLSEHGRDHAIAQMSKPLGNYVYGKLGQRPDRIELMFSVEYPGEDWYPYYDERGDPWETVWERKVSRISASQHVDIAAYITSMARAMTVEKWVELSAYGARVVRCHTDSLTVDHLPSSCSLTSGDTIGGWRIAKETDTTVIAHANAYFDESGAHVAGVSEPSYELVERLADGATHAPTRRIKRTRSVGRTAGSVVERLAGSV